VVFPFAGSNNTTYYSTTATMNVIDSFDFIFKLTVAFLSASLDCLFYVTTCTVLSVAGVAAATASSLKTQKLPNNRLTEKHIELMASRRWKEVLAWIVFHPDELLWVDKRRQTALHHACLFRAPAQVIEMMLYQAPVLATMTNVDNELPLHWAVRLSAPNEIIRWLLAAYPTSACEVEDRDGNTALSLVWERHQRELLELWWRSGGRDFASHSEWKRILFYLQSYSYAISSSRSLSLTQSMDENAEALDQHAESQSFRALHTATRCPCCPQSLYSLLLKMYKEQLRERDENGRLPLAVACLDPVSNRSIGVMTKVHLLLFEYSDAAGMVDHDNRLPIFTAIESGLVWEEGIDRLIFFAPESLLLRDPATLLPAFLLAAAAGMERRAERFETSAAAGAAALTTREEEGHQSAPVDDAAPGAAGDARSLSTIYSLLRRDPARLDGLGSFRKQQQASVSDAF